MSEKMEMPFLMAYLFSKPKSFDILSRSIVRKSTVEMDLRLRVSLLSSIVMWLPVLAREASKMGKFLMFLIALGCASVLEDWFRLIWKAGYGETGGLL